jgi:serine/threonine protein kinase
MGNLVGELLAGRYEVLAPLRTDGLVTTYRAIDRASMELVGLVLVPVPPEPRYLFREFTIGSRLSHPSLLEYRATVEAPGHAGLVAELVVGEPLVPRASTPAKAPGDFDNAAFLQLCDVIDYLHSQALVHGNLVPDRLIVQPSGRLKVIDLGHCEDLASAERFWHETRHGTPLYWSPEHLGGALAPESDYFAIGVLVWERLTGEHPFTARTFNELVAAIQSGSARLSLDLASSALAAVVRDLLDVEFSARRAGWRQLRHLLVDGA